MNCGLVINGMLMLGPATAGLDANPHAIMGVFVYAPIVHFIAGGSMETTLYGQHRN